MMCLFLFIFVSVCVITSVKLSKATALTSQSNRKRKCCSLEADKSSWSPLISRKLWGMMEVNELSHSICQSLEFPLALSLCISTSHSVLKTALLSRSLSPPILICRSPPPFPSTAVLNTHTSPPFPLWPSPSAHSINLSSLMKVCKVDLDRQQLWISVKALRPQAPSWSTAKIPLFIWQRWWGNWFLQTGYRN